MIYLVSMFQKENKNLKKIEKAKRDALRRAAEEVNGPGALPIGYEELFGGTRASKTQTAPDVMDGHTHGHTLRSPNHGTSNRHPGTHSSGTLGGTMISPLSPATGSTKGSRVMLAPIQEAETMRAKQDSILTSPVKNVLTSPPKQRNLEPLQHNAAPKRP